MDEQTFNNLLELFRPQIEKKDTVMRKSIPAAQRLSATLRFLASGVDFEDLKFVFFIAPYTLSNIVMETCEVINEALKDNIQASVIYFINIAKKKVKI